MLRGYLCGATQVSRGQSRRIVAGTARNRSCDSPTLYTLRNALQDLALASLLPPPDRDELRKRMGGCNARAPENPEFYLRLRDYFVTPLWMKVAHGN